MDTLRTPDARFKKVAETFPYEPHSVDVEGLEMAYVEAGDTGAEETFLCMHGEPTWGFLYRKMLPTLAERGRVVVPDLIGFGRSEKPAEVEDHTFELHAETTQRFIEKLDLTDVTLVCQDWGGILGLLAAAEQPDRFARLVPMNTGVPDGTWEMPEVWHKFHAFVAESPELPIGFLIREGCATDLDQAAMDGYEAPFPTEDLKAGARAMPQIVPIEEDMDGADRMRATQKALGAWDKPAFVLFGDSDPITRSARDPMRKLIPTASEQPDVWVEGAGHFLQEDKGEQIAEMIVEFVNREPLS